MTRSIYLINPAADLPTYLGAEVYAGWCGTPRATFIADLAVPTVAGMAPQDFDLVLCDQNIEPIDFETPADLIAITGKVSQFGNMRRIAAEFRSRGKTILMGGPLASLSPEMVRPHCDILVQGEMEEISPGLFSDLRCGKWRDEYVGTRPDLSLCNLPDWSRYPNDRALVGTVQTSRGCPFSCEFCDVIQYLGRKQRHKPISLVLDELDQLYRLGYRGVLLADDNFTVHRSRAKEILQALGHWNRGRTDGRMKFMTQVSIDAARDEELLQLCAQAGIVGVFIGIESPNEESLRETKKRQNVGIDMRERILRFIDHGMVVYGGMIVGFDCDGPDIFDRQYEFAMTTPIPVFTLGALVAPPSTPLFRRLADEGRLALQGADGAVEACPWETNIVPVQMTRDELKKGLRSLCNRLYQPAAFRQRVEFLIDRLGTRGDRPFQKNPQGYLEGQRSVYKDSVKVLSMLSRLGPKEAEMWLGILRKLSRRPEISPVVMPVVAQYVQIRYMYERGQFWEQAVA